MRSLVTVGEEVDHFRLDRLITSTPAASMFRARGRQHTAAGDAKVPPIQMLKLSGPCRPLQAGRIFALLFAGHWGTEEFPEAGNVSKQDHQR